jgi:hypothetical protein
VGQRFQHEVALVSDEQTRHGFLRRRMGSLKKQKNRFYWKMPKWPRSHHKRKKMTMVERQPKPSFFAPQPAAMARNILLIFSPGSLMVDLDIFLAVGDGEHDADTDQYDDPDQCPHRADAGQHLQFPERGQDTDNQNDITEKIHASPFHEKPPVATDRKCDFPWPAFCAYGTGMSMSRDHA